jgi:hypothetical protein
MDDPAVGWSYRAELETRIAKCHSLLRRVSTPEAEQRVNQILAELGQELLQVDE